MPTRILFWNIRDFSINKINNPSYNRQTGSTITEALASQQRLDHIHSIFEYTDPEIFVLIETETAPQPRGSLVRGGGKDAAILLLQEIRNEHGDDWRLVPPIVTGPQEAVSVYYRSTNRYFTGPNIWSGGQNGLTQAPNMPGGDYPNEFLNLLPNRNIPGTAPNNANVSERRVAARVNYTYNNEMGQLSGDAVDFYEWRAPYWTTFAEYDNNGVYQRTISLFSVHSPASYQSAEIYLEHLSKYVEIINPPAPNEVKVIAGDFNANVYQTTNNYAPSPAYNYLINRNYALTLKPSNNPPQPPDAYPGYLATHIKPADYAVYGSTNDNPRYYPGYGYIGASIGNFIAIDNIFVRYGGAPVAAPVASITNTVVGSPFNLYPPPPNTPVGNVNVPSLMDGFNGFVPPQIAPAYNRGVETNFTGWVNYGRIYSVSDHFALAVDI